MKQKDIALIIFIVVISSVISFFLSNLLFSGSKNRKQLVEVVEPISAEFHTPDKQYFNDKSVDPTQLIKIGENTNQDPFHKKQ
jgi:hypothetical protein